MTKFLFHAKYTSTNKHIHTQSFSIRNLDQMPRLNTCYGHLSSLKYEKMHAVILLNKCVSVLNRMQNVDGMPLEFK